MNNPLELLKFVQGKARNESEALQMLAVMADAPPEDYQAQVRLPTQSEIPSFQVGGNDAGSLLAGFNHGEAAPVIGQEINTPMSIGELLVGDE